MKGGRTETGEGGCCPPDRLDLLPPQGYEAQGQLLDMGIRVYVVGSASSKKGVLVIPDIFGIDTGRHKGIADQLAREGYLVAMPDVPLGEKITREEIESPTGVSRVVALNQPAALYPEFDKVYAYMQSKGAESIGVIGFCWGSWALYHESARGAPIKCGVNAHPSLRLENFAKPSTQESLAERIQHPMLMMPCGNDPDEVKPEGSVSKILAGKLFADQCEWYLFSDMSHGFVTQGDVTDAAIRAGVDLAYQKSVSFLKKHL